MDKATASSFLNDPQIAVLTCPHTRFERVARIRAVEKSLHDGKLRTLYVRVPSWHSNKVPQFVQAFPTCTVTTVNDRYGKYLLLKITPKDLSNDKQSTPRPESPGGLGPEEGPGAA